MFLKDTIQNCVPVFLSPARKMNGILPLFCITMISLEQATAMLEESLSLLGVNPEEAKCEGEGQWLVYRGDREIYLDLWEEEITENAFTDFSEEQQHSGPIVIFQVLSPVGFLPEDNILGFLAELLHVNLNLLYASYTINEQEKIFAVKFRRPFEGLGIKELKEAVDCVGYYAELSSAALSSKYDLRLITPEY